MKRKFLLPSIYAFSLLANVYEVYGQCNNSGIGTNVPTSKLHIVGCGTTSATSSLHVNSSNISNQPLLFVRDDGNVGLGTNAPTFRLQVVGGGLNGEMTSLINGTAETFLSVNCLNQAWSNLTKNGDNGIFWKDDGSIESNNGFVLAPWSASTKGVRIDGASGFLGIGTGTPLSRLEVFETNNLGAGTNNNKKVLTLTWKVDGNNVMNHKWLRRKNGGTSWTSTVIHDGISVDSSFSAPNRTRTWWERDPDLAIHSWGDQASTFMTLSNQKLDVFGKIQATNEIVSTGGIGQFRAISGSYGFIVRNDGSATYMLLTASGDPTGTFGPLRPFYINNTSGDVFMASGMVSFIHSSASVGIGVSDPKSKLEIGGSLAYKVAEKTASGTLGDETVVLGNSGSAITLTLPSASASPGRTYIIKKIGAGNVTVQPTSGQSLDGTVNGTFLLDVANERVVVVSAGGSNWYIIN